jgi:serine/threonine-protein kinase
MIGRLLSHFRITSALGAGGMGEVYRAIDLDLGREVAIKVLPEELARDEKLLKRLEAEAKALASLNHPNIVTIYSFEHAGDVRFLSMELVEGVSLAQLIPPTGLALDRLFEIALPLCQGLAAAHERNVVHRDLKPENVMVTPEGRIKILDFGLARRVQPEGEVGSTSSTRIQTSPHTIVGTVPYMSPEQLHGQPVDHRTDIFSLGVMMYEMTIGRRPFRGATSVDLISSILRDAPSPISEVRPDVPRDLQRIIERALEKEASRRHDSVAAIQHDLERIRGGQRTESESSAIHSIAVLPLENLSRDPAQEYFADGMTEALITDLAKVTGLKVISRMSVMGYRGSQKAPAAIARELGVDALVEGTVITADQRLRVTAHLIDGRSERHLWAERYDRDLRDVLRLQDELARSIAGEVRAKIAPQPAPAARAPVDPEVYRLDLKGRHQWAKRSEASFRAALDFFQQAIDIDPSYAPAYVGLADCFAMLCNYGILEPATGHPRARAAVNKALELDPASAEAHRVLALCQWQFEFDWLRAEQTYRRALELDPNSALATYWYGAFLGVIGRQIEGLEVLRRAEELDPLSLAVMATQGWLQYFARRFDDSLPYYRRALDMNPRWMMAHWFLGQAQSELGQHDAAVHSLKTAMDLHGPTSRLLGYLGYALGRAGRHDEARQCRADLAERARERYVPPYFPALVDAGLGQHESAMALLEEAYRQKDVMLRDLLVDPPWEAMRSSKRFQELMAKMHYPGQSA